MLIVGVDTSGRAGSLALCKCSSESECQTLELVRLAGGTYSAQFVPQLAAMLSRQALDKNSIDAFSVVSGPGSFTGLRVGLSAVKALAEIMRKPIATVSMLEAVAWQAGRQGRLLAVLDAGRGQTYVGDYQVDGQKRVGRREWLATTAELVAFAKSEPSPLFTPDELAATALRASGHAVGVVRQPQADLIARIGYHKIMAGQTVTPEALDANYIRRSDAEIFSLLNRR